MASNSFMGTSVNVGNTGCRSVIDEVMNFRTQVTRKDELRAPGGWKDPLNELLARGLGRIRRTLSLITSDPLEVSASDADSVTSSAGQAERQEIREEEARDENVKLKDLFEKGRPISTDDIQMPAGHMSTLPYDFSGKNPDYPQMSDPKFKNVFLSQFITVLDMAVKDLSNLACATYGNTIPAGQSAMVHSRLEQAYAILQEKGGENNLPEIADGTDPESLTGKVGPDVEGVTILTPTPEP